MLGKKKLLGQRLKELRKRNHYTLAQLSEKINLEPSSLGNIENGYNYPKISTLEKLAEVLNCSMQDFFNFDHQRDSELLLEEIYETLQNNPDKIKCVYRILVGLLE